MMTDAEHEVPTSGRGTRVATRVTTPTMTPAASRSAIASPLVGSAATIGRIVATERNDA